MPDNKRIDEQLGLFEHIRIADGNGTLEPRLERRVATLSRNEEEHTSFELCYVGFKGRTFLALCTLLEERLYRVLTITTEEALNLQTALKDLIDDNSLTITAPITDE